AARTACSPAQTRSAWRPRSKPAQPTALLNGAAAPSSDLRLCGNGRLDRSEECDASSAGPACCNATTCMLHSWATCRAGSGACCSGCRLRPAGSICRASTNNCDLPELCNGTDEACPDDSKLADWQPCAGQSGGGTSSGGACPASARPPGRPPAKSASAGPLECYEGIKLDPCATLMCVGGQGKPVHELKVQWPNSTELKCRYKSMDIALPDGSSCPSGTACLSGRCLQPPELAGRVAASVACPRDSQTHLVCSGRGVCTTRAACLCRPGWTGRSCERRLGPNDRVNLLQQLYWSPAQGSRDSNRDGQGKRGLDN
uniref:Disintegrin domain-containing protein n=1 Tax=Macrostomum lignano TaxID=282301 RepID=A0A1I8IHX3_9PLAT